MKGWQSEGLIPATQHQEDVGLGAGVSLVGLALGAQALTATVRPRSKRSRDAIRWWVRYRIIAGLLIGKQ